MSRRQERLNEQFRREIAIRLQRDVHDPRVGGVTVTAVRVTPDLAQARVLVRIRGTDAEREEALAGLEAAGPFLRRSLGADLHIRRSPELQFQLDHHLEQAMRIEALLDNVRPDGGWEEGEGSDEPPEEVVDSDGGVPEA
jgi:ribosome-binding factor A